ncbi:MAG: urea ABC transporter permease subunit UrtB [Pseudomonadota bacterium]
MRRFLLLIAATVVFFAGSLSVGLQTAYAETLQPTLQDNSKAVERASRRTIAPVIEAILESGSPNIQVFLEKWREKEVWLKKEDGQFYFAEDIGNRTFRLIDIDTGAAAGEVSKRDLKQLKPNSGVRAIIAAALVQFQLLDPDPARRQEALSAIERDPEASHLAALRASIGDEPNADLKERKTRLERLLTIRFAEEDDERVEAINHFASDTGVDVRATLNQVLQSRLKVAVSLPETENVARILTLEDGLVLDEAYARLTDAGLAEAAPDADQRKAILIENIDSGEVAGVEVASLDTQAARDSAYAVLVSAGNAPPLVTETEMAMAVSSHVFYQAYVEPSKAVTDAASGVVNGLETRLFSYNLIDLGLDGLSLASIYFLAAIGLAITFGVMGVINMAHGEFIMIGAYTGYVVQQFIPNYTVSILVALPLAFAVAFAAGVAMERLVIRHLMHRPLETLLATFGISIALQQIAKNIFGTQARPLTSPDWLDGALVFNDVIAISYIRIAIFVLALIFLALLLFILKRTRLGLEVRAVTQNPRMAASMGINPDRVNMLTFGLGSGIAGIAGVAIGLFAQVTSELGSAYIVQSFMTVVVGGVGNIWGTLAGAGMIGSFQKVIEWFNPSNTLAAQTYMIIIIIIFIQFRPKGMIPLKGRAAGD